MIKNYMKIALRNLLKHKLFSFINIIGLAIGITACILISSYIYYEMNYEKFNINAEHIYRVQVDRYQNNTLLFRSARSYPGFSKAFKEKIPEIIDTTRVYNEDCLFKYDDTKISGQAVYWVDNSFIDIFDLKLINTSAKKPLKNPYTAVLTQSAAKRFFGDEDPIGKTIVQNEGNLFIVTGVMEDYPLDSHLKFDFLLSLNTIPAILGMNESVYFNVPYNFIYTYILATPGASPADIQGKMSQIVDSQFKNLEQRGSKIDLFLQPVTDIHLKSDLSEEISPNSSIKVIYSLSFIALIILIMAWVNFINLSTSRALERAKEVGARKVAGSNRIQIIGQFIFESIMLNLIAIIIALTLLDIIEWIASDVFVKSISLPFFSFPQYWLSILLIFMLGGVVAALYPALLLSSFNPLDIMKGSFVHSGTGGGIKKALVVFQFTAAVVLIICTLVITRQIDFIQNQDLGFNSDQVLVVNTPRTLIPTGLKEDKGRRIRFFNMFKETLIKYPSIKEVTASDIIPGKDIASYLENVSKAGSDPTKISFYTGNIEYDYFRLLGIDIATGKSFNKDLLSGTRGIIINEKAVEMLGFSSPEEAVNNSVNHQRIGDTQSKIIGVVSNYNQAHLRKSVPPIIYFYGHNYEFGYYLIKLNTQNISETLKLIESHWAEMYPDDPFDYFFLDDFFDAQYDADRRLSKAIMIFSSLLQVCCF